MKGFLVAGILDIVLALTIGSYAFACGSNGSSDHVHYDGSAGDYRYIEHHDSIGSDQDYANHDHGASVYDATDGAHNHQMGSADSENSPERY